MKTNYFASLWIANLGVVPLFSLAFFLLAPAFFLFNFLLILVCVVFEDISKSLSKINFNFNRMVFLSRIKLFVKAFCVIALSANTYFTHAKDIFLSKGEQIELNAENLKSFSVGNKEVLKYKYLKSKGKLYIKGKSLGFSDLIIWKNRGPKEKYQFYITSKREQLKNMALAQSLQDSGLQIKVLGDIIKLSGNIKKRQDLLLLKKIIKDKSNNLILNVGIHQDLKTQIIGKIYSYLENKGFENYFCEVLTFNIECFYEGNDIAPEKKEILEQTYGIKLIGITNINKTSNYNLHFHIISHENFSMDSNSSGFKKINGQLEELIRNGAANLQTGEFYFLEDSTKLKLVAKPNVKTTINNSFLIELGKEIPIETVSREQIQITWKFIGLKIKGTLFIENDKLKMNYEYRYTYGSRDMVSGPKGKAQVFLKEEIPTTLFNMSFNQTELINNGIPTLKDIPLVGPLFKEEKRINSQQIISAIITVHNQK